MSTKNDGGPAFPFPSGPKNDAFHDVHEHSRGMTMRDWFAGMAMQGMVGYNIDKAYSARDTSQAAYLLADAMLEAREA